MLATPHPKIAIVADAHFHDLHGDYGLGQHRAMRRLFDTAKSTRVFNESFDALHFVLDDIVARGIQHLVLLGDYSDDGQHETLVALRRILDRYSATHGLRFYAIPGNHDVFGADGRHRSKKFLNGDGGYDVATSNPLFGDEKARRVVASGANYCFGYPKALQMLPDLGLFGSAEALHWETPFGASPAPRDRSYPTRAPDGVDFPPLMDASYLVEPFDGVWLMMIDANVFVPHSQAERAHHDEDYADSTDAGWIAMPYEKPFVLKWMKDVAARAERLGKQLVTFSHYPILDPVNGTLDEERALLGATSMTRRIPGRAVADAVLDTGIKLHFHGHVHINDTARYRRDDRFLINVSVPSLVAFPAGYKVVEPYGDGVRVETVEIGDMPINPVIEAQYRAEIPPSGAKPVRLLHCENYGAFLFEHLGHLVSRRHLRRDWPEALAAAIRELTLADLVALAALQIPLSETEFLDSPDLLRTPGALALVKDFEVSAGLAVGTLVGRPALGFLEDWYRLRMGSDLALPKIGQDSLAIYAALAAHFEIRVAKNENGLAAKIALLLAMFTKLADGLPSQDFDIDLRRGEVLPAS